MRQTTTSIPIQVIIHLKIVWGITLVFAPNSQISDDVMTFKLYFKVFERTNLAVGLLLNVYFGLTK